MTSRALGTGVVLAVTLAAAVVALPAAALPAPAPDPHGPRADFNGDGYPDLAFAAPGATVKGFKGAGYVGVAYGSRDGIKDSAKRVFTQASAGVPGTPEAGDAFGSAVASADLDQDGYADLVVGSQGEKIGAAESAGGGVSVLWGGPGGLAGGATLLTGEEYDGLGRWLAVGDFDGDGAPDVVGAGHMALHTLSGPFTRDGAAAAATEIPNADDWRNLDVAAGDLNGDGRDDLAVVANDGDEYDARRIMIGLGSPAGLGPDLTAVKGKNGYNLQGGEHIAVGNVNNDRYADLAVGRAVDGYDSDLDLPLAKGGMLTYVPGGASGPQGTKAVVLNQDSPGVPGAAEHSDNFGASVAIGDTDGDGYGEIAVGVPGEDQGTVASAAASSSSPAPLPYRRARAVTASTRARRTSSGRWRRTTASAARRPWRDWSTATAAPNWPWAPPARTRTRARCGCSWRPPPASWPRARSASATECSARWPRRRDWGSGFNR